jgi:hypothetical protein
MSIRAYVTVRGMRSGGDVEMCDLDVKVHHVDESLIDTKSFGGESRSIEDRDVMEFWSGTPILIENQKQLLCTAQGEDRDQTIPTSPDNSLDSGSETSFSFFTTGMIHCTVGGLDNEDIWLFVRDLSREKMTIQR